MVFQKNTSDSNGSALYEWTETGFVELNANDEEMGGILTNYPISTCG